MMFLRCFVLFCFSKYCTNYIVQAKVQVEYTGAEGDGHEVLTRQLIVSWLSTCNSIAVIRCSERCGTVRNGAGRVMNAYAANVR